MCWLFYSHCCLLLLLICDCSFRGVRVLFAFIVSALLLSVRSFIVMPMVRIRCRNMTVVSTSYSTCSFYIDHGCCWCVCRYYWVLFWYAECIVSQSEEIVIQYELLHKSHDDGYILAYCDKLLPIVHRS